MTHLAAQMLAVFSIGLVIGWVHAVFILKPQLKPSVDDILNQYVIKICAEVPDFGEMCFVECPIGIYMDMEKLNRHDLQKRITNITRVEISKREPIAF